MGNTHPAWVHARRLWAAGVPELRQLRAFVAVAEELNFTRAAERLHLGQQAVSKSIGLLERELGVALLERTTREVRLTPAGAALLDAGRDALLAADAAFEGARTVGRGLTGTVRIGLTPPVGSATRAEVVAVLRDGAADLSIAFHEIRPGEIAAALRERTVYVVLARTSRDGAEVDSAPLRPSPAELLVPAGHALHRPAAHPPERRGRAGRAGRGPRHRRRRAGRARRRGRRRPGAGRVAAGRARAGGDRRRRVAAAPCPVVGGPAAARRRAAAGGHGDRVSGGARTA